MKKLMRLSIKIKNRYSEHIINDRLSLKRTSNYINIENASVITEHDKLGVLIKKEDINLKQFDAELDLKLFNLNTEKEKYIFRCLRNEHINTIDHPTISLNYEENSENILRCYVPVTNGTKYKLVYLDIKHNLIIVRDDLVDVVNLGYVKLGALQFITKENSIMVDQIYKLSNNYRYYEFSEILTIDTIEQVVYEKDKIILERLLINSDCNNFMEYKLKLINSINKELDKNSLQIKVDNINIKALNIEKFSNEVISEFDNINKSMTNIISEILENLKN